MKSIPALADWNSLLDATSHADSIVRCDSARLLGELGDPRAVPALTSMLERDAHTSKITAVYALGAIGDRKAVPVLRRIADDPGVFRFPAMHYHDMIRLAAAMELARWNEPSGITIVSDLLRMSRLPALFELSQAILSSPHTEAMKRLLDYVSLPYLLSYHHDRTASSHYFLARALAYFQEPAARKQLVSYLSHFSRYVRPEAASSLLAQDASKVNLCLVASQAKRERTPFARIRFARILHEHGVGDATAVLTRGLKNKDSFVRATAIDAAAACRISTLAPAVIALLTDADFYVRICAAEAMENLAPQQADGLLAPLLKDSHPRVAVQAAKSRLACARIWEQK
ncbi:MAG: HEAT repeat domain-containing protein [Verrucomicrobiota bacterium]